MVQEIVIHLGDHKTGSTSIQHALLRDHVVSSRKIIYPVTKLHHGDLARAARRPDVFARQWSNIMQKIEAAQADVAVISTELFEHIEGEMLRSNLEQVMPDYLFRVRLIAYVRPHADRLLSTWAERVKLGVFSGDLESFFRNIRKNGRFIYTPRFQTWRSAFGDRFELRPMIRSSLHGNCVVRDFVNFVLNGETFDLAQNAPANETMTLEDLSILSIVHGELRRVYSRNDPKDRELQSTLGRNLAIALSGTPRSSGTNPAIHKNLLPMIQDHFAEDARALDATFFKGNPMQDALANAERKTVDAPQKIDPENLLSVEELRLAQTSATFIAQMAAKTPNEWPEHFVNLRRSDLMSAPVARPIKAE